MKALIILHDLMFPMFLVKAKIIHSIVHRSMVHVIVAFAAV